MGGIITYFRTYAVCKHCNLSLIDNIYNSKYCGYCQFSIDNIDNNSTKKKTRACNLLYQEIR
jgi:predicted adenine nucleotide alpha hydrolase (AANH) superfamily ATPase